MLFNTSLFGLFFFAFFAIYHFILREDAHKLWLITLGSLFFYGLFSWWAVPVLLGTGTMDYFIARVIHRTEDKRRRKRLLVMSIVINLGVLGFFKYTNFAMENAFFLLRLVGVERVPPVLRLALPVGISFYTFQSISYIVDVYRGQFVPRKRAHQFIASLTFFPHLAAGPIVRASSLLPQFEKIRPLEWSAVKEAIILMSFGLLKKSFADLLAPVAEGVFGSTEPMGFLDAWTGALAFVGQIYGDFSGYTDMAIGMSLLLGFRLPVNFNLPYLASNIAEYWKRWHISLSTWFNDYLFMPLALKYRTHPYFCLLVTWVLVGLWHGPRWNFVVTGLFHGCLLVARHWLNTRIPEEWSERLPRLQHVLGVASTFYFVTISEVIFRSQSWSSFFIILREMHWPKAPSVYAYEPLLVAFLTVGALVLSHALDYVRIRHRPWLERPYILWPAAALSMCFCFLFGPAGVQFIYFQF